MLAAIEYRRVKGKKSETDCNNSKFPEWEQWNKNISRFYQKKVPFTKIVWLGRSSYSRWRTFQSESFSAPIQNQTTRSSRILRNKYRTQQNVGLCRTNVKTWHPKTQNQSEKFTMIGPSEWRSCVCVCVFVNLRIFWLIVLLFVNVCVFNGLCCQYHLQAANLEKLFALIKYREDLSSQPNEMRWNIDRLSF